MKTVNSPEDVTPLLRKLVDNSSMTAAVADGDQNQSANLPTSNTADLFGLANVDLLSDEIFFRLKRSVKAGGQAIHSSRLIIVEAVTSPYIRSVQRGRGYEVHVPKGPYFQQGEFVTKTETRFYDNISLGLDDPFTHVAARAVYEVASGTNTEGHDKRLSDLQIEHAAGWRQDNSSETHTVPTESYERTDRALLPLGFTYDNITHESDVAARSQDLIDD